MLYEFVFIASHGVSELEVKSFVHGLRPLVKELGGDFVYKDNNIKLIDLSYIVRGRKKGFVFFVYIECPQHSLMELKRKLKLNEHIIRFMCRKMTKGVPVNAGLILEQTEGRYSNDNRNDRTENKSENRIENKSESSNMDNPDRYRASNN